MMKLQSRKKSVLIALSIVAFLVLALALCLMAFVGRRGLEDNNGTIGDASEDGVTSFTFGNTYTIGGREYTLGEGENEYIDYHTALGLDETDRVTLKRFTYPDGTDGTEETTAVRHAGTYEFEAVSLSADGEEVTPLGLVIKQGVITLDIDVIPDFFNAQNTNNAGFKAHGDILTIYHANDGWYMTKGKNDIFIESKVITNAYYYKLNNKTDENPEANTIYIAIGGETAVSGGSLQNKATTTSKVPITFTEGTGTKEITFNVSDRSGFYGTESQEYVAAFKFDAPTLSSDYTFEVDKNNLKDDLKWTEIIPNYNAEGEFDGSFTVTKHWWIIAYGNLFTDQYLKEGSEPYSPFGFGRSITSTADDQMPTADGSDKPNKFTFVNEVIYRESRGGTDPANGLQVRLPAAVFDAGRNDSVYFSVQYTSTDGVATMLRTYDEKNPSKNTKLSRPTAAGGILNSTEMTGVDYTDPNSLAYYFNYTMPAGDYVLTLYGVNGSSTMISEYTLKVKPAPFNAKISDVYTVLDGKSYTYPLKTTELGTYPEKLLDLSEESLATAIAALNATLLGKTSGDRVGYWVNQQNYYDTNITLKYNRRVWNANDYVELADMLGERGALSTPNSYTFYYSINAKNYLTAGGADDTARLDRYFTTKLTLTIGDDIYKYITATPGTIFNNVTYTGSPVQTTVPSGSQFYVEWNDSDYTNVHQKASVTLVVADSNSTSWAELPSTVPAERVSWTPDKLTVYFDILPADNSYTSAPTISPWRYEAFDASVNRITYELKFGGNEIGDIYFRIGKSNGGNWIDIYDNDPYSIGNEYFKLDSNGQVPEEVAAILNELDVDTYYLGSYVSAKEGGNVNAFTQVTCNSVSVWKTSNVWTQAPSMTGWDYKGFTIAGSFIAGTTKYGNKTDVEYTISEAGGGATRATFKFNTEEQAIDAATVAKLNDLEVKTYQLSVKLAGGKNYEELIYSGLFSVGKARNLWSAAPQISGWVYKQFEDSLLSEGTTGFGAGTYLFSVQPIVNDNPSGFVDGFKELSAQELKNKLNGLNANSYNLRVTVPAGDNYEAATPQDIRFRVSKADNEWNGDAPTIEGWTYDGKTYNQPTPANATAKYTSNAAVYKYYAARNSGGALVADEDKEYQENQLATLPAGTYIMVVTVKGDENYNDLVQTVIFSIAMGGNDWSKKFAKTDVSWTWHNDAYVDTLKPDRPVAFYGDDTVVYTLQQQGGRSWTYRAVDYQSSAEKAWNAMLDDLKAFDASTYNLTVFIAATNTYDSPEALSIVFTIDQVKPDWTQATKNAKKTFNDWKYGAVNSSEIFEPVVDRSKLPVQSTWGTAFIYTLISEDDNSPYSSWKLMMSALEDCTAGSYTVSVRINGDTNHEALEYQVSVIISVAPNSWTKAPKNLGADSMLTWVYGAFGTLEFEAQYNNTQLTITLNGTPVTDLMSELNKLGGGTTNTIVASVPADDKYGSLIFSMTLTIEAAPNSWVGNLPRNTIVKKGDTTAIRTWEWNTQVEWLGVQTKYGTTITIVLGSRSDAGTDTVIRTFNDSFSGAAFAALVVRFNEVLSSLGAGKYYMNVSVESSANWTDLPDQRVEFEVTSAENRWTNSNGPKFEGKNITLSSDGYHWAYGTATTEVAPSRYGVYTVKYYKDGTQLDAMPTDAGSYKAVFSVSATGNYDGIADTTVNFTIDKADEHDFERNMAPNVSDWIWDAFDARTYLFTARPKSGGDVWFEIRNQDGTKVEIAKFRLVNADGVHSLVNFDENLYAPAQWEGRAIVALLKDLPEAEYTLWVYVDATDNYNAFEDSTTFKVTAAMNSWITTPQIMTWSLGGWVREKNSPKAEAYYGTTVVSITSDLSPNKEFYKATYDKVEKRFIEEKNELETADVGLYTMLVTVEESVGRYNGFSVSVAFEIYIQGSKSEKNFWTTSPSIADWVADIDKVGTPVGTPARGKPYFVFYTATWNSQTETWEKDKKVEFSDDTKLVEGSEYAQSFWIPMKPGRYIMYGCALNAAFEGDDLGEDSATGWPFTIYDREISWEKAVSIASVLELSDYYENATNWGKPSATASLKDSVVTYKFFDAVTNKEVGTTVPAIAGKYYVVAYASARYTQTIESRMDFEVKLSKNYWINDTSPSIENWSEEFNATSPNPTGEAAYGEVVYTYVNRDTGEEYTSKPTEAGNYTLIARVEKPGYEVLEAHYDFVIEPAYDSMLITICIILAAIASVLSIVVITFAIKRNKEN